MTLRNEAFGGGIRTWPRPLGQGHVRIPPPNAELRKVIYTPSERASCFYIISLEPWFNL